MCWPITPLRAGLWAAVRMRRGFQIEGYSVMAGANSALLVDDDPEILALLGRHLTLSGIDVRTALSGAEALRILGEDGPQLVITDWNMPEMDGLELCRRIRALESFAYTYLIILTAFDDVEHVVAGFQAGADDYITKPADPKVLVARVTAGLRIVQMESYRHRDTLRTHKVNAELAVANATLRRMARSLEQARRDTIEAEAVAEAANQVKANFLANVSHEIRTPLTAIMGFAEAIADIVTRAENVAAIKVVRRNADLLFEIVNDILDFAKIEAGTITVHDAPFSLSEAVNEVVAFLRPRAVAKRLTLDVEYAGDVPGTVRTDQTRLRQILVNLIGNAIKFTETGSVRLLVGVKKVKDQSDCKTVLLFDVVDTGVGIDPGQVAGLFEPFSQADTSATRRFGGTGLGLTISKRFAEMLGGSLVVLETEVGKGSHFRVTITATVAEATTRSDPGTPKADGVGGAPKGNSSDTGAATLDCRILLVEDGPDNQKLFAHILRLAGATVAVSENGQLGVDEAMTAWEKGDPFDIILMDMQMPVMDGYEATALLRSRGYALPIVALTAHAMSHDREKCMAAGCDDYAPKPIDRKALIAKVQQWVASSTVATAT